MKRSTLTFVVGLVFATLIAASSAQATSLARSRDGSITAIDGDSLTMCFRHAPLPAIGDTLSLVREWIPFSKGTPASPRYHLVGYARVVAVSAPPCVQAEKLHGKPRRYDRARPDEVAPVPPTSRSDRQRSSGYAPHLSRAHNAAGECQLHDWSKPRTKDRDRADNFPINQSLAVV